VALKISSLHLTRIHIKDQMERNGRGSQLLFLSNEPTEERPGACENWPGRNAHSKHWTANADRFMIEDGCTVVATVSSLIGTYVVQDPKIASTIFPSRGHSDHQVET
jgi:hypothetical protein